MPSSDGDLVDAALRGSRAAAGELFSRYWDSCWRAAFSVVGVPAIADDVAQEAFERAFGALERFERSRPFAPWLHRIAINRGLEVMRRERRTVALDERPPSTVAPPDEQVPDDELVAALRQLSPERRTVVLLRYWLDYSPTEIADLLGVPVGTVSSRLARSLAALRSEMEAQNA